jgi:L-threonylcarbamoyladenylate synthase
MSDQTSQIQDGRLTVSIDLAVKYLKDDLLIGLPTETVYGLAALASRPKAIAKIFQVKARPTNHPLILHLANYRQLEKWARNIPAYVEVLCDNFWPGPLTIVLQRTERVCDAITGARETVAIRVPNNQVALTLLKKLDDGLVAPSANRFGKVSPTSAKHVVDDLGDEVALVLDGGNSEIGVESTILDCTRSSPQILRLGAITKDELESVAKISIALSDGESRASGMLEKHYAPNCRVELVETAADAKRRQSELVSENQKVQILDFLGDVVSYANQLYARLRQADQSGIDVVIAVIPINVGLGEAIRDRLTKASAATNL